MASMEYKFGLGYTFSLCLLRSSELNELLRDQVKTGGKKKSLPSSSLSCFFVFPVGRPFHAAPSRLVLRKQPFQAHMVTYTIVACLSVQVHMQSCASSKPWRGVGGNSVEVTGPYSRVAAQWCNSGPTTFLAGAFAPYCGVRLNELLCFTPCSEAVSALPPGSSSERSGDDKSS